MFKFKILATGFLTMVLGAGVAVGAAIDNNADTVEVGAATTTYSYGGERVYLDVSSWEYDNARYAVYCWNDSSNWWVDMTSVTDTLKVAKSLYKNDDSVPTHCIFARMNGTTTSNNWNNKWNQSGNYKFEKTADGYLDLTDKNCVKVSSWDNWTTQAESFKDFKREILDPEANENFTRIWVDRGSTYSDGYDYAFHYWGTGFDCQYLPGGYRDTKFDGWYVFFDIPVAAFTRTGVSFQFKVYNSGTELFEKAIENSSQALSYENGHIFYVNSVSNITRGTVGNNLTTSNQDYSILVDVLSAYDTCSSSTYNGYGAFSNLQTVWNIDVSNSKYSSYTMTDKEYEGQTKWTIAEKVSLMSQRYLKDKEQQGSGISGVLSLYTSSNVDMTIILISLIAFSSICTGILVFKRRKQSSK